MIASVETLAMNSPTRHPITEALVTLVKGMCSHPEELDIEEKQTSGRLIIDFAAHSADAPVLIGRLGRQATALKFLASEMGNRAGMKVDLQIRDNYRGVREPLRDFTHNPNFKNEDFTAVLNPVLEMALGSVPQMEFREEAKGTSLILDIPREKSTIAQAIANAFYPFAIRKGRKIRILNKNYQPACDCGH
jgi:predicted RNA-binding protein YlqC (UPF0109 family)